MNWTNALLVLCVTTAVALGARAPVSAVTFSVVHSFDGADGTGPSGLIRATNGNLYGATGSGGSHNGGTVFKLNANGSLTTLYDFCSQNNAENSCTDGAFPEGVIQAANGYLYGTTNSGGASSTAVCLGEGCGTVFKLNVNGTLTTLLNFDFTDGLFPSAAPFQATNGIIYGITSAGGLNPNPNTLGGALFKIAPNGTRLASFSFGGSRGASPTAPLIQAANGDLYGTTSSDGANSGGTVFRLTPNGTPTTLYNFCAQSNCADGAGAYAPLVQASNGSFYGTTAFGGANGQGAIFKISASGAETTVYSFCSQSNCMDGQNPFAGLIEVRNGNLCGTTSEGGAGYNGTVFCINSSGALTTLYNFCSESNCTDGAAPEAGLIQASNGYFYGTTSAGGADNDGTIFEIVP